MKKKSMKWNNLYEDGRGNRYPETIVVRFVKNLIIKKNSLNLKALDIGCGLGAHSIMMSESGVDVLGLDVSQKAISNLNKVIKSNNITNLNTVCAGIEDYELEKNKYDLILDVASLQHADSLYLDKIFLRIKLALKLNGYFYSWFLIESNNINDNDFEYVIINKKKLKSVFSDDFKISFDNYKYSQNNGQDYIDFLIFSAERIK